MNRWFFVCVFAILSGCSTLNHEFSCRGSARDHCLSIDEVHALHQVQPSRPTTLWVGPFTDEQGVKHGEQIVQLPPNNGHDA